MAMTSRKDMAIEERVVRRRCVAKRAATSWLSCAWRLMAVWGWSGREVVFRRADPVLLERGGRVFLREGVWFLMLCESGISLVVEGNS